MKTKKNLELYSDEYEKETQRENAYVVFIMLGIIRNTLNISEDLSQAIFSAMDVADLEIGTKDIVITTEYD